MKGTLPSWLERLLGVSSAEAGEGTVWSLDHSWPFPSWLTLLFVAFCLALVAWVYLKEGRTAGRLYMLSLGLVRLLAVCLVLLMIAELVLSRQRTGLPYVVVIIDDSASMSIVDRYGDTALKSTLEKRIKAAGLNELTRLNLAKSLLINDDGALLKEIEQRYKLKVYFASAAARADRHRAELVNAIKDLEATGPSSRLGAAVRTVLDDLRGTPPTAIVLLTDGINTDGERLDGAAAHAQRRGVPLFTVALGSEEPIKNLKLHDLLVDEVVFVDDVVNFEFTLTPTGLEGRTVVVALKDQSKDKAPLAKIDVKVGADGLPQKLTLPYRPAEVGEFRYVLETDVLTEEDQREDNRLETQVRVRKEQIKVLLVQSGPSFEYRRLKDMLERDASIELKTVLQEADLGYAEVDKSALKVFPVRRDELFVFDVIIFGDVNPAFLSATTMTNIADFVKEQGRGIVFVAGPLYTPGAYRDTPLDPLFPIDLAAGSPVFGEAVSESFAIQPTELGLVSPHMQLGDTPEATKRIWADLPGVYWLCEASKLRPAARVLAEHPLQVGEDGRRLPVFSMQYVGKGKVLFHATDETWRWRFRLGDVLFARYWVQTIRYLSRSKLVGQDSSAELTTDRREYRRGEPVRIRVQFLDERVAPHDEDGVTVVLERSGQSQRQIKLRRSATSRGVFEGTLASPADGAYHARVAVPTLSGGAPSADFSVVAPPGEFKRVEMDAAALKAASALTGGKFYLFPKTGRLIHDLPEGRQVPVETLEPLVLWNKWPLVLAFVGMLVTEWVMRKRKGLL